ncbi:MAG: sigma-70 family RNA polymerase sigma factor [Clostridia bacterium]|nr:sigma-70 family RNA polymerase sigma factor [Clostridia bacterium]
MAEKNAAVPELQTRDLSDLAALARGGDEESFSLLVKAFQPVIFAIVASIDVPPAEKDDLSQEGLIGLYKAVRLFDPSLSSFGTFARLCIRSAILDGLKRYRRVSLEEYESLEETVAAASSSTPERIVLGKEALGEILQKMEHALSPDEKRIFALRLEGNRVSEIARLLGKDKKSVENALFRARKKLS